MVVLKMIDLARLSFKKETLFASYCIWRVEISYPISLLNIPIDQYLSEVSMCPAYP